MKRTLEALLCLGILIGSSVACEGRALSQPPHTLSNHEVAIVLWNYHRVELRQVLDLFVGEKSGEFNRKVFSDAVEFLQTTTGIYSNTATVLGRIPTTQLVETAREWDRWFEKNQSALRFDPGTCQVKSVVPGSPVPMTH